MSGNRHKKGLWLDPRAKLFLILMCVLSSMFAPSLAYQFILVMLIAILGAFFGKWKYVIKAVCFYAVICALTVWIMAEMTGTLRTMFIAFLGLFHKVCYEPCPRTQKVSNSYGSYAAVHSNYSRGLALYHRRYANERCFTISGGLFNTSGHDG